MTYRLAFYKGRQRLLDRVIQGFTRSSYSHVELVKPEGHVCVSSSGLDGGVRQKEIDLDPEKWDVVEIGAWVHPEAWDRATEHLGAKYDFAGILFSQAIAIRLENRRSWFCSELIGHALGFAEPHMLSPGTLYLRVLELNRVSAGLTIAA